MKNIKKLLFLMFFLFVLSFLFSSCSSSDPLRSSIQSELNKYGIQSNVNENSAEIKLLDSSNVCECEEVKNSEPRVKVNKCSSGNLPKCEFKIDHENPEDSYLTCSCVPKDSGNDCVDNNKNDDTCSWSVCTLGETCNWCTNSCGEEYVKGNCQPCGSGGTCFCSGSSVTNDNCDPGYSASCRSDGSCVCASDEE